MAKASATPLLFFILFFISAAGMLAGVNAQQKNWCVVNPSAEMSALSNNTAYACSQPGVDCGQIGNGGPCYYPNTTQNHASVAMNLYYQAYVSKFGPSACYFSGTGLISITDPSYDDCKYS